MVPTRPIPAEVVGRLGYYIYAYVNPVDGQIFYIGKGKGQRALSHLDDQSENQKTAVINQIRASGHEPRIEVLAHGLETQDDALRMESALIDAIGIPPLVNLVRGWRSSQYGRRPLKELVAFYRRVPVEIQDPSLLIRINELYRPQLSASELYDTTRGVWKVGPKREKAKYALAIFEGIVREVYEIIHWLHAGETFSSRGARGVQSPGRWEFVGRLAPEQVRLRYVDRDVSRYFKKGSQYPVIYVNVA